MKDTQDREHFRINIIWSDGNDIVVSSYGVKKKSEKKNVLLLQTMRPLLDITKDHGKKVYKNKLY